MAFVNRNKANAWLAKPGKIDQVRLGRAHRNFVKNNHFYRRNEGWCRPRNLQVLKCLLLATGFIIFDQPIKPL
jgi:hypothetical protein